MEENNKRTRRNFVKTLDGILNEALNETMSLEEIAGLLLFAFGVMLYILGASIIILISTIFIGLLCIVFSTPRMKQGGKQKIKSASIVALIFIIIFFIITAVFKPLRESTIVLEDISHIKRAVDSTYQNCRNNKVFFTEIKSGTTKQDISEIFLTTSTAKKIEGKLSKEFSSIRDPWGNPYILTFTQGKKNSNDESLNESLSELRILISEESLKKAKDEEEIRRVVKEHSLIEFEPKYTLRQE